MAVFVVTSNAPNPALDSALGTKFGKKMYRFSPTVVFVMHSGTARELSEALGVTKGGISGVVVTPTTGSYYGVANTALWDWLRAAFESNDGG